MARTTHSLGFCPEIFVVKIKMKTKYEIDMSEGALFTKLVRVAFPVMLSGILQLAFNACDLIVVGRFAGETALAAVGSNSALVSLIINVLLGICTGTSVIIARYYGAKDENSLQKTVCTSVTIGLVGGVIFALIGIFAAEPLLRLMGTPEEVLPLAALYLRIYFAGLPVLELYNFSSAILRAVGDTRRPLYFLALAGVINIFLNLFFVVVVHISVAGVALATVLSQCVSCVLVLITLIRSDGIYRLDMKNFHFSFNAFKQIMRIGLPAGIQSSLFSVSNVIIQSSINSFGAVVMAGNSAASSVESFIFTSLDAVNQSSISSISQNMGARAYPRTKKSVRYCLLIELVLGEGMGWLMILAGRFLLGLYTTDAQAIEAGMVRVMIMGFLYCTNGMQHMMGGVMRAHGYSLLPTAVTFIGICGFRIFWIFTVFASHRSLEILYASYPISWVITFIAQGSCYLLLRNKAFELNEKKMI